MKDGLVFGSSGLPSEAPSGYGSKSPAEPICGVAALVRGALGVEDGGLGTWTGRLGEGYCPCSPAAGVPTAGCCGGPPRAWPLSWLPRLVGFDTSLGWEGAGVLSATFPSWSGDTGRLPAGNSGSPSGLRGTCKGRTGAGSLLLGELERELKFSLDAQSSLDRMLCLKNLSAGKAFWE